MIFLVVQFSIKPLKMSWYFSHFRKKPVASNAARRSFGPTPRPLPRHDRLGGGSDSSWELPLETIQLLGYSCCRNPPYNPIYIYIYLLWNEHLSSNSLTCRYVILPMHSHVSWKHLRSPARHFRLRLALGGGRVVSEPSFYPLLWPALSGRNVEQRSTGLARWKNNWLCSAAAVRFHIEGFSFWLPLSHHSHW